MGRSKRLRWVHGMVGGKWLDSVTPPDYVVISKMESIAELTTDMNRDAPSTIRW